MNFTLWIYITESVNFINSSNKKKEPQSTTNKHDNIYMRHGFMMILLTLAFAHMWSFTVSTAPFDVPTIRTK